MEDFVMIGKGKKTMEVPLEKESVMKQGSTSRQDNVTVENSSSTLTVDIVKNIFTDANISPLYEYLIPLKHQRANDPPDGYITVYKEQVDAGLRFPLHELVVKVCNMIKISPSQLVPNSYYMIVGFILCAKLYKFRSTPVSFFSLFNICRTTETGVFKFCTRPGKSFLRGFTTHHGLWKKKYFFLRYKETCHSWNCLTQWQEDYMKPPFDSSWSKMAENRGILDHHFHVDKLSDNRLLVHGGIQLGVPSQYSTFEHLMHEAGDIKLKVLPDEDRSPVCASAETPILIHPPALAIKYSDTQFVTTSTPRMAHDPIPGPPSTPAKAKRQNPISTTKDKELLSPTEISSGESSPYVSDSEDRLPLKKMFRGGKRKAAVGDEAEPSSAHLLALSKFLESAYVPKESYEKLEKERDRLASRVQKLEKELERSEGMRAMSDLRNFKAREAVKAMEKVLVINLQSDAERRCAEMRKEASEIIECLTSVDHQTVPDSFEA